MSYFFNVACGMSLIHSHLHSIPNIRTIQKTLVHLHIAPNRSPLHLPAVPARNCSIDVKYACQIDYREQTISNQYIQFFDRKAITPPTEHKNLQLNSAYNFTRKYSNQLLQLHRDKPNKNNDAQTTKNTYIQYQSRYICVRIETIYCISLGYRSRRSPARIGLAGCQRVIKIRPKNCSYRWWRGSHIKPSSSFCY